jgi:PAS domain-containing protein
VAAKQKQLLLILAREFLSNLSTASLIADAEGNLVFYNEAAESGVVPPGAGGAAVTQEQMLEAFEPRLPPERRPTHIAFEERRAAHDIYVVTSADGIEREIEVTAFPLFAHSDEFVGIVAIFWRR